MNDSYSFEINQTEQITLQNMLSLFFLKIMAENLDLVDDSVWSCPVPKLELKQVDILFIVYVCGNHFLSQYFSVYK